jgi:hypothetical protein
MKQDINDIIVNILSVTQREWAINQDIKRVVVPIPRLSGPEQLADSASLFRELNTSPIDYVALCDALHTKVDHRINLDNRWPFDHMLRDPQWHAGTEWTDAGWKQVCDLTNWSARDKCGAQNLDEHFSVNYIGRRIAQFG